VQEDHGGCAQVHLAVDKHSLVVQALKGSGYRDDVRLRRRVERDRDVDELDALPRKQVGFVLDCVGDGTGRQIDDGLNSQGAEASECFGSGLARSDQRRGYLDRVGRVQLEGKRALMEKHRPQREQREFTTAKHQSPFM